MLEELLKAITREQKETVGYVKGDLLEEWQRFAYKEQVLQLEYEITITKFALDFFKKKNPDGKFVAENIRKEATDEFKERYSTYIARNEAKKAILDGEKKRLWRKTYEQLGIKPEENCSYSIEHPSGRVEKTFYGNEEVSVEANISH